MNAFLPADILFPQVDSMEKWAVIACDQFTSDPAYWERVRQHAEGSPSTINLILPEAELGTPQEAAHTALINRTMAEYLDANVFRTLKDSFVYVERTLENGSIRRGLIGNAPEERRLAAAGATLDVIHRAALLRQLRGEGGKPPRCARTQKKCCLHQQHLPFSQISMRGGAKMFLLQI